jgi:phospholipase C
MDTMPKWLAMGAIVLSLAFAVPDSHAGTPVDTTTTLTSSLNPSVHEQSVTFTATVSASAGTPAGKVTFLNGSATLGTATLAGGTATLTRTTLNVGSSSITAVYAGNNAFSGSTSAALAQQVSPATTSVTLVSSPNPSNYEQPVAFTATVSSAAGTPGGKVTFMNGSASLGAATLSGGVATLAVTKLVVGTSSITAVYAGANAYAGSTSAILIQQVSPTATFVTLTSSANPSTSGQSVTFVATVTASAGSPAGKVTFMNGGAALGTATLSGGVATLARGTLTVGSSSITAVYAGSNAFSGSTSAILTQQVNPGTTSVALSSSANPSTYGQSVTFTAAVTSSAGTPTGKVTFTNGSGNLGSATLSGGVAALARSTLNAGASSITAVYAGTGVFPGSTSAVLTQQVNPATTSIALTSSANPSMYGQPVTFTATLTSAVGTPTGSVTFMNGSASLGTATLVGGMASMNTSSLPAGILTIAATYAGTSTFSAASAALTQPVTPASSTGYTLAATPLNPAWFTPGSSATSTVTVAPVSGYTGSVSLSCTVTGGGSPTPSCSFNPSTVTISSAAPSVSTLTVSTTTDTPIGNYTLSINGIDANNVASLNGPPALTLMAVPAGSQSYILSATALVPGSIASGGNATSTITVTPANGYTGSVGLLCDIIGGAGPPPQCSFNPSSVTISGPAPGTSTLTVSTSISTPAGSYTVPADATDANSMAPINGPQALTLTTQSVIQHIIVIFQENRTPDNLFQDPVLIAAGADIAPSGVNSLGQIIPLSPINLGSVGPNPTYFDLNHNHDSFLAMYDGGKMDGADLISCNPFTAASCIPNPQFKSVAPADVQPYFALAEQYTFGDRMFQTSESGSFPAHQFIIAGTSAPTATSPLFASGDPTDNDAGCIALPGSIVPLIDPNGNPAPPVYPCFEHPVLSDLLDAQGLSWIYYAPKPGGIWTAPNAIEHMCQEQNVNGTLVCRAPEWQRNVIIPSTQILTDIGNGRLPQVSWVIPAGAYSDHAHSNNGSGPSWVASIVNAVGNSPYWANTAIIITWDDWGGWYDHVAPKIINDGISWGSGYVYGFRVPLIVVSPYAKAGYISHVTHDFGSILSFIETNFNLPSLGYADAYADNLSDCFDLNQTPIPFQAIPGVQNAAHFLNDKTPPADPDDD